jgi:hypothetical protein
VTFLPFIDKKLIGKGFEFYSRTKGKELDVLFVEITFRNRSAPPTSGWMLGGGNAVIPTTCPPPGPLQMGERVNGYIWPRYPLGILVYFARYAIFSHPFTIYCYCIGCRPFTGYTANWHNLRFS